jgi:hypothetical protein
MLLPSSENQIQDNNQDNGAKAYIHIFRFNIL